MFSYEQKIVRVVSRTLPAVVSVIIMKDAEQAERVIAHEHICIPEVNLPKDASGKVNIGGGSGFFVSPDGLVLTNKHVVEDAKAQYVVFDQNGKRYDTTVLARDPIFDIAILKTTGATSVPFLHLKKLAPPALGSTVIAIGNALGEYQSSVSTGVVSGLSRFVTAVVDLSGHQERLRGLIQTDAAINPGNSGGPLLNLRGDVIGINAAVVTGAQNIGFAIPIQKAARDVDDITRYGKIRRPFLGVRYIILNEGLQKEFNFALSYGALVVRENIPGDHAVVPGSAAAKAGLEEGDIIASCNGTKITRTQTLEDILENVRPGDTVALSVLRDGKEIQKQLTISEWT